MNYLNTFFIEIKPRVLKHRLFWTQYRQSLNRLVYEYELHRTKLRRTYF